MMSFMKGKEVVLKQKWSSIKWVMLCMDNVLSAQEPLLESLASKGYDLLLYSSRPQFAEERFAQLPQFPAVFSAHDFADRLNLKVEEGVVVSEDIFHAAFAKQANINFWMVLNPLINKEMFSSIGNVEGFIENWSALLTRLETSQDMHPDNYGWRDREPNTLYKEVSTINKKSSAAVSSERDDDSAHPDNYGWRDRDPEDWVSVAKTPFWNSAPRTNVIVETLTHDDNVPGWRN